MESELPALKEKNPQLEVITELSRGQHPYLKGIYSMYISPLLNTILIQRLLILAISLAQFIGNRNERVVCVKNMDPEEVLLNATRLRNSLGRKVVKLRTRHVTKHPSVQGTWTTAVKFWDFPAKLFAGFHLLAVKSNVASIRIGRLSVLQPQVVCTVCDLGQRCSLQMFCSFCNVWILSCPSGWVYNKITQGFKVIFFVCSQNWNCHLLCICQYK